MFSCVAAYALLIPAQLSEFGETVVATLLFASNVLFYNLTSYFGTSAELQPLLHTWSLAIEEQFYIGFQLLLFLITLKFQSRYLLVLSALALASLLAAEHLSAVDRNGAFFLLHTRGWELLLGCLVAIALDRYSVETFRWKTVLASVGLAIVLLSFVLFDEDTRHPSLLTLIPVVGVALILAYASSEDFAGRLLSWKPLAPIGLISYSLYLLHQPIFVFYRITAL